MWIWEVKPVTRRIGEPKGYPRFQSFFEGKDDEDFVGKSVQISRYTVLATGFFSMWDLVLMPHQGGIPTALARIKWWATPFIGGGLTYCAVVNTLSSLRGGKSDAYNHLWAGYAVGAVLGKHAGKIQTGFVMGTFFGIVGLILKTATMEGIDLFPLPKSKMQGNAFHHKYDFTLTSEREGYWTRDEKDVPRLMARGQV